MFSDRNFDISRLGLPMLLSSLDSISADAERHHSFPDANLLWLGCSVYGGSLDEDAREWLNNLDADNAPLANFRRRLKTFINHQSRQTALALVSAAEGTVGRDILMRAQFYATIRGSASAAYDVHETEFGGYAGALMRVYRHGAIQTAWIRGVREPNSFTQREVIHTGIRMLVQDMVPIGEVSEALRHLENQSRPVDKSEDQLELEAKFWRDVEESDAKQQRLDDLEMLRKDRLSRKARSADELTYRDIAEMKRQNRDREIEIERLVVNGMSIESAASLVDADIERERDQGWASEDLEAAVRVLDPIDEEQMQIELDAEIDAELALQALAEADADLNSKIVIASLADEGDRDRKAFLKTFYLIANARTLMLRYEYPDEVERLRQHWPHAVDIIDTLTRDLVLGRYIQLRPTLVVGAPGSGKTTLLREFVYALRLPQIVYPCASVSDGSFGGTPAQWSSRRASTPLELVRTSLIANPVIILDELEKTGSNSHNGSLVHSLLPLLERHSAASYFETALETNADLSGVNFLATANNLDIPDPLRDRFRILRMPDPEPQHIGVLSKRIIAGIAEDRSINPAWIPPLDPDEIDVITKAWGGGSLRKLRVAIETTIDVRDQVMVRQ